MNARSALAKLLTGALIAVVGLLVLGAVLGQPVLFSYVETGSMQPTLEPGDGFVAIPAAVAGPIEEGDVITYRAEEVQGGGLTTHRVVGETEEGFVTRGDANPFTDQDGGEPPVKDAQIVAKTLQVGGEVVAIPGLVIVVTGTQDVLRTVQATLASLLGTSALLGVQGLAYLFFALTVLLYTVDALRDRGRRRRDRERSRDTGANTRLLVGAFAALLVVAATASMVGPCGVTRVRRRERGVRLRAPGRHPSRRVQIQNVHRAQQRIRPRTGVSRAGERGYRRSAPRDGRREPRPGQCDGEAFCTAGDRVLPPVPRRVPLPRRATGAGYPGALRRLSLDTDRRHRHTARRGLLPARDRARRNRPGPIADPTAASIVVGTSSSNAKVIFS